MKMSEKFIDQVFLCRICKFYTDSRNEIRIHEGTHADQLLKPRQSRAKSAGKLLNAPQPRMKNTRSSLECPYCHVVFSRRDKLIRHIRVHTGEKPFGCPYCPKTCARSDNMKLHMRVHERGGKVRSVPPISKDIDHENKKNSTIRLVLKHNNNSSDNIQPKQKIQDRLSFPRNMVIHMCEICDFNYTDKLALDRHWETHANFRKPLL